MTVLIAIGIYGIVNVQIDNYLTDEINKKSEIYKQTAFLTAILEVSSPLPPSR